MTGYTEFTVLFGILAVAGILIMANLRVELWCEYWLERFLMQPLATDPTGPLAKRTTKVS